jgi:hypothetical protein
MERERIFQACPRLSANPPLLPSPPVRFTIDDYYILIAPAKFWTLHDLAEAEKPQPVAKDNAIKPSMTTTLAYAELQTVVHLSPLFIQWPCT